MWNSVGTAKELNNDDADVSSYDPYDMLVKSLGYEKKEARPSERLKTDEEKLKDEKKRLQELEEDRLRRMRGEKESDPRQNFSVEDMGEDGFDLRLTEQLVYASADGDVENVTQLLRTTGKGA